VPKALVVVLSRDAHTYLDMFLHFISSFFQRFLLFSIAQYNVVQPLTRIDWFNISVPNGQEELAGS
jgi:hypothetical protein